MDAFPLANQPTDAQPKSAARKYSGFMDQVFAPVGEAVAKPAAAVAGGLARFVAPSHEQDWSEGVHAGVMGLPRTLADWGPLAMRRAPGPLKALGLADAALRSWSETPESATAPQKLGATALSLGTQVAGPMVGGGVGRGLAKTAGFGALGQRVASSVGALGGMKAGAAGQAALTGQEYDPWSAKTLAGDVASVLPWEAGGIYHDYLQKREAAKAGVLTEARAQSPELPMSATDEQTPYMGNVDGYGAVHHVVRSEERRVGKECR